MIVFSQTFLRMTNYYKITKKHYPRTNNESVLEFVFDMFASLCKAFHLVVLRKLEFVEICFNMKCFSSNCFTNSTPKL